VINRFRLTGIGLVLGIGVWAAQQAQAQWFAPNPVVSFEKRADGLEVQQKDGVLRFEVKSTEVLHVTYAPAGAASPERASDWVVVKRDWPGAAFEVSSDLKTVTLSTARMKAVIERETGAVHYAGADGSPLTTDAYLIPMYGLVESLFAKWGLGGENAGLLSDLLCGDEQLMSVEILLCGVARRGRSQRRADAP